MARKSKKNKTHLDFEIDFFEKLIREKPDFIDALIPLAEAYTKAGRHEKGLIIDRRLSKIKTNDAIVHYNLACSYSLLEDVDKAFKALKKAINLGYNDFKYMDGDPDLSSLREDKRYQKIIYNLAKKKGV